MAYTEETTTSYGQRLRGALKGIGTGLLLFLAGTCLLFWNEGNFVKTRKTIQESEEVTVHVDNVDVADSSLNGKLIHATALADSKEVLTDGLFGVSEVAIALYRNGKEFSRVEMGAVSMDSMFAHAHSSNSTWTWVLRFIGLLLVVSGLKAMFSILTMLFKVLPFLADIVGAGVGLVTSVLGFVWSLLVIAISWLFYRPFIAIVLFVVVVAGIVFLKRRAKVNTQSL